MSEKTEASRESSISFDSALDVLEDWYHVPVIGAVLAFMFWVRVQSWKAFTVDGEVYFSGNDAYYHFREVMYTVQHWPQTMPFDPWTNFPTGTSVGQFGTLYDQIVATAALVVGMGDPSQNTIALTLVFAPAVFGALLAVPVYFLGKRMGGRLGGVFAAVVLALLPGYFLIRTRAGAADHNGAEPLFQAVAVLTTMVALAVAQREKPVWEQFLDRDVAGLRRVVGWSALAGVATAAYMWMWPPGVLLVGIFGVFYLVKLTSDYYHGTSPDHVAVVAAVSSVTTGLLMFVPLATLEFSASRFSLLQPIAALGVGLGAVFLAWLARQWDTQDFDATSYPIAVFSLVVVGVAVVSVALPSLWSLVETNLLRFVGFSSGAATRTIGEAQPFLARESRYGLGMFGVVFLEYGLAFFTALLGAAWILLRPHLASGSVKRIAGAAASVVVVATVFAAPQFPEWLGGIFGIGGQLTALAIVAVTLTAVAVTAERDAEQLLVVVWGAFITSAAFTQVRFNYYLVVPVVVLNAYLLGELLSVLALDRPASAIDEVSWYQVGTVTMAVLLVLVPVAAPAVAEATNNDSNPNSASPIRLTNNNGQQVPLQSAITVGASNSPGEVIEWDDALEWMKSNTPEVGNYGGAGNADQLDYYGTYAQTDDYDYPAGSYGVMSWWDYGHWITVEGERVPHANPFQQGADNAANFLLADNESQAEDVMAGISEDDAKMRYVAVDWQMVLPSAKFGAPIQFYDGPRSLSGNDFYRQAINSQYDGSQITNYQSLQSASLVKRQAYYESMMVRLYRYHGSAQQAQPVVFDWRDTLQTPSGAEVLSFDSSTTNVRSFENMSAAEAYVANDSTSQIGGTSALPSEDVPALEHYRLVGVSDDNLAPFNYLRQLGPQRPMAVKMFERVEGAEVTGTGPANTTVTARVTLNMTQMTSNQDGSHPQFTYVQRAETGPDGEFTMTLPYSSTGYENFGTDEGYTNVSVRAAGPYEFTTGNTTAADGITVVEYNDTADVTESQVLGQSDETVTVDLERSVVDRPEGAQNNTSSASLVDPSTAVETTEESSADGSDGFDGAGATAAAVPALAGLVAIRRTR
ncbi:oligosaccharyl transferase, archaeosortase A system-associated [Halobacterium litoreum]|uniref:dolichyl-phosphooligosaccharide-protein glycotransferase n=1 Tax=Halobacterium litoreum TaxID=2039234 RepID=A0ABD5NAQ5_9EURY|nr:oligosaccharyl transferase, archaeosortase A system-associated [Halobacterium litoreum]UHH14721.1 oligosaccharyl transferase, archaeosortase A system-associated [Halobacterium litoreum]